MKIFSFHEEVLEVLSRDVPIVGIPIPTDLIPIPTIPIPTDLILIPTIPGTSLPMTEPIPS